MRLVLKLYPVAISGYPTDPSKSNDEVKKNKSPKRCVTGIIPDSDDTINGLYHSNSVMPPQSVDFWCTDSLATNFKYGKPINVSAEVGVRGDRLTIQVKEIQFGESWYSIDKTASDINAEDLF